MNKILIPNETDFKIYDLKKIKSNKFIHVLPDATMVTMTDVEVLEL